MEQVTALPVSYSVPRPCHPQTQQGPFQEKAWLKLLFLEHVWRSAMKFPFQSDRTWNIPAQSPHNLPSTMAQPPPLPLLSFMLLCPWLSSACKRQFHFSATDSNSNWVFPFKSRQEQLCQPAIMRAIFEENFQTSQEVKYNIFKNIFKCVCVHTWVHFLLQEKEQLLPVHERSQVALIVWLLIWLLCASWKQKKSSVYVCIPAFSDWL